MSEIYSLEGLQNAREGRVEEVWLTWEQWHRSMIDKIFADGAALVIAPVERKAPKGTTWSKDFDGVVVQLISNGKRWVMYVSGRKSHEFEFLDSAKRTAADLFDPFDEQLAVKWRQEKK